jgi:hypothetical protein
MKAQQETEVGTRVLYFLDVGSRNLFSAKLRVRQPRALQESYSQSGNPPHQIGNTKAAFEISCKSQFLGSIRLVP